MVMQVVFIQNIKGIAKKGDIKNVKEGYFQNFLAPNKLAVPATEGKLKEAEELRKKMIIEKGRLVEEAKNVQKKLEGLKLIIKKKCHDQKLYAAITEKDLIDEILVKSKVRLGKENFAVPVSIKTIGNVEISLELAEGVNCKIILDVQSE
jgi:large subunit ribosomal protein L9